MNSKNFVTSIFVTDKQIGIYALNTKDNAHSIQKNIFLEEDVIENGYIKNPVELYKQIKTGFKSLKMIPKTIHFVFLGQNVLIRELIVPKTELTKMSISDYIQGQIGISIHYPFQNGTFSYQIKNETDEDYTIVVFTADQNLLEDYFDILERIGIKEIKISLLSADINIMFNDSKNNLLKSSMIVAVLENNITIHIIEDRMIMFGMNDECDSSDANTMCIHVEEYIERIANYYQFNLRKGKRTIDNIILINLSNTISDQDFHQKVSKFDIDIKTILLNISDINPNLNPDEKYTNVAYISSKSQYTGSVPLLDFQIKRQKPNLVLASYLFVLTVFIFSMISLVYIPWVNMNLEIENLENINNSLAIQRQMLQDNIEIAENLTSYERNYNMAFDYLDGIELSPSDYLIDLFSKTNTDVAIIDFVMNESEKSITLLISSGDQAKLYEYSINIFEEFGIITEPSLTRWILYQPQTNIIAAGTMRVVIYYA